MNTPVFSSYIRRKDMDSVLNILVTDDVGPGAAYQRFMNQAKEVFSCEYASAFRSPIDALRLALDALSLERESGIVISAFSPAYYDFVIREKGFVPLVADVDPLSGAIDPDDVRRLAPQNARAMLISGSLGIMPDFEKLGEIGLPMVEDISQTVGAFVSERKAGDSGLLTIMSLESGSYVTAGEGAIVFAKGKREAAVLRNCTEALPREMLMSDMNAALGFAQLRDLAKFQEKRKELYALYHRSILQSRHAVLSQAGEGEPAYFAFPVVLRSGTKDVKAYARKKDIETQEAFCGSVIESGSLPEDACPQARSLALRCLLFPLHLRVGKTTGQKIIKVLATLP
jgi:dTDP-4-amino-4,6-dideoxygalactose transaminase